MEQEILIHFTVSIQAVILHTEKRWHYGHRLDQNEMDVVSRHKIYTMDISQFCQQLELATHAIKIYRLWCHLFNQVNIDHCTIKHADKMDAV